MRVWYPWGVVDSRDISAEEELVRLFKRNGYVRAQDPRRQQKEGSQRYKKGDEVRLVANSWEELKHIEALLSRTGYWPGRPFRKGGQLRLPIYGKDQVRGFLEMVARYET